MIHGARKSWIKKYFKYQTPLVLIFVVLLVFTEKSSASTSSILINEIQTAGISANDEFVELYNPTSEIIDISSWSIQYRGGGGASYNKKNFVSGSVIPANGYFLVAHGGSGNYSGNTTPDMSWSQSFSSTGGNIFLVNNQAMLTDDNADSIVDKVVYGTSGAVAPEAGKSIGRIDGNDTDNNFVDFFVLENLSPKKENEKAKEKIPDPPKTYPTGLTITELFPNPFHSQYEEYIELYNGDADDIDLLGWTLRDASKSGKYVFTKNVVLKAKKYLAIFKKDFKFALNNSGDESVALLDPNGKEIAKASYDGSKKNVSYNFDGSRWRWSKFLTPGSENVLNNEPYGKIKIDEDIFEDVYADFSISTGDKDGDKVKVTWDFGDKRKSYLPKTRHKYLKVGIYDASVKLSDGSEDVIKKFVVEVKEYPHPKVRIVSFDPNPAGKDSDFETITIQNKSKKKVNLIGWSIATGWKNLYNHPILEDFEIKPGKEKVLTRLFSKFTLNNKQGKIELRYPDGKVAHDVKYKKEKSIAEGEIYEKTKDGWKWQNSNQSSATSNQKNTDNSLLIAKSSVTENTVQDISDDEVGMQTKIERKNNLAFKNDLIKIELLKSMPRVLGAQTIKEADGQYIFTSQNGQQHYIVLFLKNIFTSFNLSVSTLLNNFF